MANEFEMSMVGKLIMFLGLSVEQNEEGMFLYQNKYVRNLVEKFGMKDSKYARTNMITSTKLSSDNTSESVHQKVYRSMIGS